VPDDRARSSGRFASLCVRLVREDEGQDLVEYIFLAAFVAIVGYVVMNSIGPAVSATYATWIDPTQGSPKLWDPADPWVSSGS
jgi:Flp pilus assembly pilin Flp